MSIRKMISTCLLAGLVGTGCATPGGGPTASHGEVPKVRIMSNEDLINLKKILRETTRAKAIKAPAELKESVKPIFEDLKRNYAAIAEAINGYQKKAGPIVGPDEVLCMNLNQAGPVVIDTGNDFLVFW